MQFLYFIITNYYTYRFLNIDIFIISFSFLQILLAAMYLKRKLISTAEALTFITVFITYIKILLISVILQLKLILIEFLIIYKATALSILKRCIAESITM